MESHGIPCRSRCLTYPQHSPPSVWHSWHKIKHWGQACHGIHSRAPQHPQSPRAQHNLPTKKTVQQETLKNTEQMVWYRGTTTKAPGLHKTKRWAKIQLNINSRNGKALLGIHEMLTFLAWENSFITTKALLCSLAQQQRRMPVELFIRSKNFIGSLY